MTSPQDHEIIMAITIAAKQMDAWAEERIGASMLRWAVSILMDEPFRPLTIKLLREFLRILSHVPTVQ